MGLFKNRLVILYGVGRGCGHVLEEIEGAAVGLIEGSIATSQPKHTVTRRSSPVAWRKPKARGCGERGHGQGLSMQP